MSRRKLLPGDPIKYPTKTRRLRAVVADFLPLDDMVPVQKRSKIVWMPRKSVRKLPS